MGLKRHTDIPDEMALDESIIMLVILLGILLLFLL